jgi:hypothetical protein
MNLKALHEAVQKNKNNTDPNANVSVLFQLSKLHTKILALENKMNVLQEENSRLKKMIIQEMHMQKRSAGRSRAAESQMLENISMSNKIKNENSSK